LYCNVSVYCYAELKEGKLENEYSWRSLIACV
jgi:hypothetical protein